MTEKNELFNRIEEIFESVIRLPLSERQDHLERACKGDSQLLSEVRALLDEDARCASNSPTQAIKNQIGQTVMAQATSSMPKRIGNYRIIRECGQGGMGTVYEAVQDSPERRVALKMIRPGMMTRQLTQRFQYETEFLGRLQHAGVGQIFEAGVVDLGAGEQPYFVMEFIDGAPLLKHIRQAEFGTTHRLMLFSMICDAIQHAHQRGVIHRDLKPENILVVPADTGSSASSGGHYASIVGQPKVLDFGIARATNADVQATMQTDAGALVGTLQYMSPEQAAGASQSLDVRSDVYALGVILFEMLCDRPPYDLKGKSIAECISIIREQDPSRLSSVHSRFRGDLETIVGKCLEKDPERRYASASELAGDVRRHMQDEPIVARPASTLYQIAKFAKRNRGLVAGVVLSFVVLVAAVAVSTTFAVRESAQRRKVEKSQANLQQVVKFQKNMLGRLNPYQMGEAMLSDLRDRVESGGRERGLSDEKLQVALTSFDAAIDWVNSTDMARTVLNGNILAPASEAVATQFTDQPLVEASLRHALASMYRRQGLPEQAVYQIERALEIMVRMLGPEDRDTLRARSMLSLIWMDLGRNAESLELLRELTETWERVFGAEYKDTLSARMCLAVAQMGLRRNVEAQAVLKDLLEIQLRTLGPKHADVASTRTNLGLTYFNLEDYRNAVPLLEKALETQRELLGEENSQTATSHLRLAEAYQYLGRRDEAVQTQLQALNVFRRIHGERFPKTVDVMADLAGIYQEQAQFAEAERYARKVLQLRRELLGESHPDTIDSVDALGAILGLLGRHQESEPLLVEALERSKAVLGEDVPPTLGRINNLGVHYWYIGRLHDAEPLFQDAVDGAIRHFGEQHGKTAFALANLTVLLTRLGRLEESQVLAEKAVAIYMKLNGPNHFRTLNARASVALIALKKGDYAKAERIWLLVHDGEKKALGPNHPVTLETTFNLGVVYRKLGRLDEAVVYLEEYIQRHTNTVGADHLETLNAIWELALVHIEAGRRDDARPLLKQVIAERRKAADSDDASAAQLNAAAKSLIGSPIEALRDPVAALGYSRKANDLTHHDIPEFLSTLAESYHKSGDTDLAVKTQEKALDRLPDSAPNRSEYEKNLAKYADG